MALQGIGLAVSVTSAIQALRLDCGKNSWMSN